MPQRVLITAGAAGIGREFVRAFTAKGANVFVCDIDDKALAAIAKEIPGIITRRCDMASRAEIERMVPEAVTALGGLDVLINNAGIAGLTLPVAEYPPDDWDKVVAVNLTAMFDVSRLAIPYLKKSTAGCIINMSSIAGRYGFPNRSPYAATKWGVIGLTKTLAMELGEWGIRANAIAPGAVEGDRIVRVFQGRAQISGRSLEDVKADALAGSSIKAMIDPKDIAQLAGSWPRTRLYVFLGAEPRPSAVEQFHRAARNNPIVDCAEYQGEQPSDNDAPDQPIDPHA